MRIAQNSFDRFVPPTRTLALQMRNLDELGFFEIGIKPNRQPPTAKLINEFQTLYGIEFPADYLALLRYSNGGYSKLNAFVLQGLADGEVWCLDHFYHLSEDREDLSGLWAATPGWRAALSRNVIPIATDGCGNQVLIDFDQPPSIELCIHDEAMVLVRVADSFGEFVDMLTTDPGMI
jgi:hypothetical protein